MVARTTSRCTRTFLPRLAEAVGEVEAFEQDAMVLVEEGQAEAPPNIHSESPVSASDGQADRR
jgi:hypothetical protein